MSPLKIGTKGILTTLTNLSNMSKNCKVVGISFDKELLQKVDNKRGRLSRSAFVMMALEKILK
jgi:hypothetical protein